MAQIKLLKGQSAGLSSKAIVEGQLLFALDTGIIYLDTDTERVEFYKIPLQSVNDAIDALEALVGSTTVSSQITTAIEALDKNDTAVTGQFVTEVSETDGIISVVRAALQASDIPDLTISKITGLQDALDAKQDALVFGTAYDKDTNKAATIKDIEAAVEGLAGAMHFIGTSTTDPATDGATVEDVNSFNAGDVVLYGNKEYVYNGTAWIELGDETSYAVKGSIKDADIAADAAIAQSKIAGLTDALDNIKATGTDDKDTASVAGAKLYADSLVDALDVIDTAVDGEFVTAVSQTDGKITVTRAKVDLEWGTF